MKKMKKYILLTLLFIVLCYPNIVKADEFGYAYYPENAFYEDEPLHIDVGGTISNEGTISYDSTQLKFLSITASNLDEFFMVRVASLKDMVHADYRKKDLAGLTPLEQLKAIGEETHKMIDLQLHLHKN